MANVKVNLESPVRLTLKPPVLPRNSKRKPKVKTINLNLNEFRNNNHFKNNSDKIKYHQAMEARIKDAFKGIEVKPPIAIKYELMVGTHRLLDIANILTIVDKFFCDSLVKCGVIEDDNYKFVDDLRFKFKGYEKNQERILIEITFDDGEDHE